MIKFLITLMNFLMIAASSLLGYAKEGGPSPSFYGPSGMLT
jgi:hypothetical protein